MKLLPVIRNPFALVAHLEDDHHEDGPHVARMDSDELRRYHLSLHRGRPSRMVGPKNHSHTPRLGVR